MMKRHNQILAGILVIQIILSVAVFWPKSAATGASEPLFPDLKAGDIVALTITEADGKSIALQQVAGNGSTEPSSRAQAEGLAKVWVLPEVDDYPAKADKITPLLDKIVGLTTSRLVTRTDASHKRLQVAPDDFVRRIDFETAGGTKHTLYLGSSPAYSATHFRVDGQSETYLTNEFSTWEVKADAASWVDTAYLSVPKDDITKMTLENINGTFTFTKGDEGKWTMAGLAADETLDEAKVTSLIQRAASVNMVRPLGNEDQAAYGMDEPRAVVTLETKDKTITLRVGAQDPTDNSYVVISSESPYYVRVSEYSVKDLAEKTRDDFLQVPLTPTPEGTPNAP
jgi:hypothetical protein